MKISPSMKGFIIFSIILIGSFALTAFAQTKLSRQETIEKAFQKALPDKSSFVDCQKPYSNKKGLKISVGDAFASAYCLSKYNGANVIIDISFREHYNKSVRYTSVHVGNKKISYDIINIIGQKAALREYNNGSYKNLHLDFFGDGYHFNISATGKTIMSKEDFLSILSEVDLDALKEIRRVVFN